MMRRTAISPWACALLLLHGLARAQAAPATPAAPQNPQVDVQRSPAPPQRIPQQKNSTLGALQGIVLDDTGLPVPGVEVHLEGPLASRAAGNTYTSGDGIFRLLRVPEGSYDLILTRAGVPVRRAAVELHGAEVLSVEVRLPSIPLTASPLAQAPMEVLDDSQYRELSRRPDAEGNVIVPKEEPLPPASVYFKPQRDRWGIPFPNYHRYEGLETPYIMGHWFDPFNRNILKADKPILRNNLFFSFTGDSITAADARRLPTPSGQSTANPGEHGFLGNGGQFFIAQTFRTTGDLFHGDTSAFRPVDWRIRVTMAANLNYIDTQENQVVSPDVRFGTTRFDTHVGLQEAFGEVKLHDFGPNYDFVNLRGGIQSFVSDFRGFVFADEQPGVRLFGNLKSNRFQYNLVGFDLLEKNSNSGLNSFSRRGREVAIGNLFIQDAIFKGYTAQFSYHFARDDGKIHYDDNGFPVRPAPIGTFQPHRIDAHYFGWTGDGHINSINVTHAFYQVRGHDSREELSDQYNTIDAQLGAIELSKDHDWLRFRTSYLYASGDGNPRDHVARGFSSIVDGVAFAGGEFSFFNREGIPLTRAGVALKSPDSFLPDLRSSKDEGMSNFDNPGIMLANAGFDADVTQRLKVVGNFNFLQFTRTQTLDFLLQQNHTPRSIGYDSGLGVIYRPFLSDNIVIHAGATSLVPSSGLRQIYTSQTLFSAFVLLKFQF